MYKNSFSNHYEHLSKQGSKIFEGMKVGYTPSNHSYAILGINSNQSPFLTKMNKKSINSRNDKINKVRSSNTQVNAPNPLTNIAIPNEVV